jgi:hypothetical protein
MDSIISFHADKRRGLSINKYAKETLVTWNAPLTRIGASHKADSYLRDDVDALCLRRNGVPDEEIGRILIENAVSERLARDFGLQMHKVYVVCMFPNKYRSAED